jgi:F-type H+-transporting ATPase subunit delta
MKNLVLVKKYAQGLVQAVDGEPEFRAILSGIESFLDLYAKRKDLRSALESPFISAEKRAAVLGQVLKAGGAADKTVRFLLLIQEHKRLDLLRDIAAALPETWNEKQGILTFEVSSVVPLTDGQKARLAKRLETAEGRPVSLAFRIDPGIVGGLSVKKGNIVYDASIQGNLDRIREQIQQG